MYKEYLPDGINAVNPDGDVVPRDDLEVAGQIELFSVDEDHLGYNYTSNHNSNPLIDSNPGISVSLADRALALEDIMASYNQDSKIGGIDSIRNTYRNRFDMSYDNPDEIRQSAQTKAERLRKMASRALKVLNASDEMLSNGYNPDDVLIREVKLGRELRDKFGPGNSDSKKRANAVKKAATVAKKSQKSS